MYDIKSYPSVVIIDPRTGKCTLYGNRSFYFLVCTIGEKMMSWGTISPESFIHELSEFLANNPYEEETEDHHLVRAN